MNYYEHHLGDWAKDTVHLTMLEEGAYRRLVDVYYVKEKPLPKAIRDIYKLARAGARPEREAVDAVLREFFQEREDGWHHKRCDEELARYAEGQEDAVGRRENDKERQRRARERRKQLFEQLRGHGIVPAWDSKTSDLEAQLSRVTGGSESRTGHADVTQPVTRDNTAIHTPVPSPQSPDPSPKTGDQHTRLTEPLEPPQEQPARVSVSREVAACFAMKTEGIGDVNPGHPDLIRLLGEGAGLDAFVGAARTAVGRHKGFAYALGIVNGQMAEAKAMANGARKAQPTNGHSGSKARAARMAEASPGLVDNGQDHTREDFIDTEARDVTPRRLG